MTKEITRTAQIEVPLNLQQHALAPYACDPFNSKGRLFKEEVSNNRSEYRRDCDRIIHSTAFRRLEYKTQVFVNHEGDHYRTRLTHSLEVAQIARSISRNLSLCEDLAEAMALAHDLGHTPFGHAGQDALQDAMKGLCDFNHNIQSLRILTELEQKYAAFDGLNLTWELLEGLVKHNGPITGKYTDKAIYKGPVPEPIAQFNQQFDLALDKFPSAEAQIAAFADDIAYNNHDIDDGLRAGLFGIEDVKQLPIVGNMFRELHNEFPTIAESRLIHEANRRMINRMVVDLTRQTLLNIKEHEVQTVDDIRNLSVPVVGFSKNMAANVAAIKEFLSENMYRHYKVCRMTNKAQKIIKDLFETFYNKPECLPGHWRERAESAGSNSGRARFVADFIAGMTDRFAVDEHKRLFDMETKV
jgi:dGTPase